MADVTRAEAVLQRLYELDIRHLALRRTPPSQPLTLRPALLGEQELADHAGIDAPGVISEDLASLVEEIFQLRDELDTLIDEAADHWRVKRMTVIDRNILRHAAYALRQLQPHQPAIAPINDAVELARRYGTENSANFIHGVAQRMRELLGHARGDS